MKNKKKTPPLLRLAIITTITVMLWIVFEVYRSFTTKPPLSVPPEILSPLNPSLDAQSLIELQRRIQLEEGQLGQTILLDTNQELVVDEPEPVLEPEPVPELEETEVATDEASLNV